MDGWMDDDAQTGLASQNKSQTGTRENTLVRQWNFTEVFLHPAAPARAFRAKVATLWEIQLAFLGSLSTLQRSEDLFFFSNLSSRTGTLVLLLISRRILKEHASNTGGNLFLHKELRAGIHVILQRRADLWWEGGKNKKAWCITETWRCWVILKKKKKNH